MLCWKTAQNHLKQDKLRQNPEWWEELPLRCSASTIHHKWRWCKGLPVRWKDKELPTLLVGGRFCGILHLECSNPISTKKKEARLKYPSATVWHSCQHPSGMLSAAPGFSHGLSNIPPDCYLPSLRSGRPFESHYPLIPENKKPRQKPRFLFLAKIL